MRLKTKSKIVDDDYGKRRYAKRKVKVELYNHQKIAKSYMTLNDSFALFMEQGTGKTLPTLLHIKELLESGKANNALIIAPKSTMGAWERDIELFTEVDQRLLNAKVSIINYDKVWRTRKGHNPYDKTWDVIVLDEAHFIKNRTSKRSAFILKLSVAAKYRYILTGTPIGNGQLENIWSQYTFLDPYIERGKVYSKIFGGSYYKFQEKYCILNRYWKPTAYINVSELQDIIAEHSYRVTKEECLDLPDKLPDEVIRVELKAKKPYNEMAKTSTIMEHEILAENPLSRMLKLRQLASGFMTDNYGDIIEYGSEKIEVLDELIESLNKKIVIYCEFKHSIKQVGDLLKKRKIKHVKLDGDQKDKNIWRKFQSDESIQAIIVQYQSGSAGIDLFASDTIIYYEPTLRSTTLEQSRDRIHRSGQTSKCSYLHLITKGTVEVAIYRALQNYSDFSERLFDEYMYEYSKGRTLK